MAVMTNTPKLLEIENVTKLFPGVRALDSVSFDVVAGEVHGLVGENGAGKSTLMAVASGALKPSDGSVKINGTVLSSGPEQARNLGLAIVRQEPSLMPDLTVAENLFLGLPERLRPPPGKAAEKATQILKSWSDDSNVSADDLVASLNPEQRFIVEICKALASEPKVLVLDEPTEHLAAEDVERLFSRIRAVTARGASVVYISHRLREVQKVSQRLTVLRDGKGQGTYTAQGLSEKQIVELIVGGALEHEFPAKSTGNESQTDVLEVNGLSGEAFKDVTLNVRYGEILGLAGVSDNGQREFLRALAGLELIRDGTISVNGRIVPISGSSSSCKEGIRLLPGDRHRESIFSELSVRENFVIRSIESDLRVGFVSHSSERKRANAAIEAFRVKTPSTETRISSLSGGNQQKLILASVIETSPRILLVDEPTQGVDVGARAEIYAILRSIADNGTAIIVVSSDAAEIAGLCDRIAIFSRGHVVSQLEGDNVTENNITTEILTTNSLRDRKRRHIADIWNWAAGNVAPLAMVLAAVIAIGLYGSSVNEYYFTARNMMGVMALVATLALVAYGQQLVMLVGGIDLSVGTLMGLVGVVGSFYLTAENSAGDFIFGFCLMMAVALAVGLTNWFLVEPLNLHPMVGTLVTYMAVQAISLILRPAADGFLDYDLIDRISTVIDFVPVTFIIVVLTAFVLEFALYRSFLGISLRGLGSREEAARVAGVRPGLTKLTAYVGCSFFAALAGITMIAQVGVGDPTAGGSYTLSSVAAVVIGGASLMGGRGSFLGALLGAILINQVNVVATFLGLSDAWQFFFLGLVILASVAFYSKSRQMIAL